MQQRSSLQLMLELMPYEISIHPLVPLPGSEYWQHPQKCGIRITDPADWAGLYYHSIPNSLRMDYLPRKDLAFLFHTCVERLGRAGYRSTDEAEPETEHILSTPFQEQGFRV